MLRDEVFYGTRTLEEMTLEYHRLLDLKRREDMAASVKTATMLAAMLLKTLIDPLAARYKEEEPALTNSPQESGTNKLLTWDYSVLQTHQ